MGTEELKDLADGAGKRSRTPDLRITNALLYQLSYSGNLLRFLPTPLLLNWPLGDEGSPIP